MPKKSKNKPLSEMTPEEQRTEYERLKAEEAKVQARRKRLHDTGFYEWSEQNNTENHGDTWLAAYVKALEDAAQTFEGLDTPIPELQDVIAAAIRELKESN